MTPAEPQTEHNDLQMVSTDSLLMKIPQVTREEWEAASKQYFKEAAQWPTIVSVVRSCTIHTTK